MSTIQGDGESELDLTTPLSSAIPKSATSSTSVVPHQDQSLGLPNASNQLTSPYTTQPLIRGPQDLKWLYMASPYTGNQDNDTIPTSATSYSLNSRTPSNHVNAYTESDMLPTQPTMNTECMQLLSNSVDVPNPRQDELSFNTPTSANTFAATTSRTSTRHATLELQDPSQRQTFSGPAAQEGLYSPSLVNGLPRFDPNQRDQLPSDPRRTRSSTKSLHNHNLPKSNARKPYDRPESRLGEASRRQSTQPEELIRPDINEMTKAIKSPTVESIQNLAGVSGNESGSSAIGGQGSHQPAHRLRSSTIDFEDTVAGAHETSGSTTPGPGSKVGKEFVTVLYK